MKVLALRSNQVFASTALANVTDMVFSVEADVSYWFHFALSCNSDAGTTGIRIVLAGPAVTFLRGRHDFGGVLTNYGQPAAATANGGASFCIIEGLLRCSAAGTFAPQVASEVNGQNVYIEANSTGILLPLYS